MDGVEVAFGVSDRDRTVASDEDFTACYLETQFRNRRTGVGVAEEGVEGVRVDAIVQRGKVEGVNPFRVRNGFDYLLADGFVASVDLFHIVEGARLRRHIKIVYC